MSDCREEFEKYVKNVYSEWVDPPIPTERDWCLWQAAWKAGAMMSLFAIADIDDKDEWGAYRDEYK